MPFQITKGDYILFIIALIVFEYSFFFYPNIQIYISSLVCIYEMFHMTVLVGKPRLREINKRFYIMLFILKIKNKFKEGIDEYHEWRKNK